ncbi:alpha/beta fold hydrolase [Mariniradius sediminis]|uniref:Alpha/beta fold hydrolase n=1 Tax=Mariniradius sediminis TaxID=2909237 RepID=A0ABS9BYE3_9BACT|nr:alpha/beta fold hydrolase [Mariniradius sediminis]MCF1752314.1 alpha/beta fold hydrolase [Mariniradius sediminis]
MIQHMKPLISFLLFLSLQTVSFGQNVEKTYLLVHGAWHGAWCWDKIVPLMEAKGYRVVAIDLPSHGADTTDASTVTFDDYVSKVTETAHRLEGKIILVGHSMGGTVISQAGEVLGKEKVDKLVYLDAFLPRDGESVSSLARMIESSLPVDSTRLTIGAGLIVGADGKTSTFKPEIADILFYNDCSQADREFAHERLSRQAFAPLGTPVSVSDGVYGAIPKYYILCTESKDLDKSILPTRVQCEKVLKIRSSHSPFFSKPKQLANMLMQL